MIEKDSNIDPGDRPLADGEPTAEGLAQAKKLATPDIVIPFDEAMEMLDVLRLTPIYTLLNSEDEGELGDDFKPHKWIGCELEHAEKANAAFKVLLAHMTEQEKWRRHDNP